MKISNFKSGNRPSAIGHPRRGVAVVLVVVVLVLIAVLCGSLLRLAAARRAQARADERRLQAEWLADSGLERAAARLAEGGSYAGETWRVAPEELGGPAGGVVRIGVEAVAGRADRRRVRVRAEFPADSPRAARRSKEGIIELGPESRGDRR
jgi:hypothetical protein